MSCWVSAHTAEQANGAARAVIVDQDWCVVRVEEGCVPVNDDDYQEGDEGLEGYLQALEMDSHTFLISGPTKSKGMTPCIDEQRYDQCRHGDAHYIAPSAPLRGRACCKRWAEEVEKW